MVATHGEVAGSQAVICFNKFGIDDGGFCEDINRFLVFSCGLEKNTQVIQTFAFIGK